MFLLFIGVYVAVAFVGGPETCKASAAHADELDYCFTTTISITNTGTVDLTDQPVRVLFPAASMINSGQLDSSTWDAFPILGSADNELSLTAQSLSSNQSPWWLNIPSLPAGQTRNIELFSGKANAQRANEFRFTGREKITVDDGAGPTGPTDMNGIGGSVQVEIINHDATVRTNTILDKYLDAATDLGYKVELVDQTTHNDLVFTTANTIIAGPAIETCSVTWNNSWNDARQVFLFDYPFGGPITIYRNGSSVASCATVEDIPGVNTLDLLIGEDQLGAQNLTGMSIERVFVDSGGFGVMDAGLHAAGVVETSSVNPYSGTIVDNQSSETITYEIDASQAALSFKVGQVAPNDFDEFASAAEGNSVVGPPVTSGFENARPTVASGVLFDHVITPLNNVSTATGAPSQGVIAIFFYLASMVLAVLVYRLTRGLTPLAILVLGIGPTIAVVLGYVPEWSLILWGLTAAVVWFAQLRAQSAS